ncbi:hypothetical protein JTE90_024773 [Oedothorax gibbosus]|uniref:YqaJ viral recombinase domain-containing protein n=1 Tax=Oedothorax gibbosus TaxID=931172 RepID=A0AAV6U9K3_9ARAC|nr:hypothetical protein JTE90_024773 [Oedothorax gibbosus]
MSDHKYYTLILIGTIFIKLVSHSQSLSDKPVQPWVIATVDGVIESAHCTSSPCKNCRKLLKSHSSKLQQRTSSLKQKLKPRVNCGTNNRAGRITTSNSKAAGITKLDAPSITTIKRICYPEKSLFHSKATSWGCNHEKDAKSQYAVQQSKTHDNFELSNAGLIINEKYPFLGSSPDGLVSCACCGLGCIEVKCPYCLRDSEITKSLKHACLEVREGELKLSKKTCILLSNSSSNNCDTTIVLRLKKDCISREFILIFRFGK